MEDEIREPGAARVRGILLQPRREWQRIEAEPFVSRAIYRYIGLLAALPAASKLIGILVFGYPGPLGTRFRPTLESLVSNALIEYAATLAAIFILILITGLLSSLFGGRRDMTQAIKTIAYAFTAVFLAGLFAVIPGLGILKLTGLYSLYLLYCGLPVTMKIPGTWVLPLTALIGMISMFLMFSIMALT